MRKAFSLIELILSIVIVGITMLSVPTILFQTVANNNSAIIQESVMDAKTRIALVLKAPWGCFGNASDFATFGNLRTPIFNQTGNPTNFNFYTANGIVADKRRNINSSADAPGSCAGGDRINSFAGDLNISTKAGYNRDAIVNSRMNTTVTNQTSINNTANANIKEVAISVNTLNTNSDGSGHTIILRAYSANIGDSPNILTRTW